MIRPLLPLLYVALAAGPLCACAPDFTHSPTAERPGAAGQPELAQSVLIADDGMALPMVEALPVDASGGPAPVRAVIVALHGFNDRKAAFALAQEQWRQHGIASFAYDQRGFGANPDPGIWPGSRTLAADLFSGIRAARRRFPGVPVYALGESMGGAVVLDAVAGSTGATGSPPDGVILSAPAVWGRATETLAERVALFVSARLIPSMRFSGQGFAVLASDNIPMLRELSRDPLFIKETRIDAVYGLVNLMDEAVAAAPHLHLPALVLLGGRDELIPRDAMARLVEALPDWATGRSRVAWYPRGCHMLLRDLERAAPLGDIMAWIFDHDRPLPSGADQALTAVLPGLADSTNERCGIK